MSELNKKVSYLKGLAEGMNLKEDSQDHKLMLKILDVLSAVADEIEVINERQNELDDYLMDLDEDLSQLAEIVYEDEADDEDDECDDEDDECDCCCGCGGHDGDIEGDSLVEYECPNCGHVSHFDITDFNFEEDYLCPECNQPMFPEQEEEEDEAPAKKE